MIESMNQKFSLFKEEGQGLAEYGLLLTAVALTAVGILSLLGMRVGDVMCQAVEGLGADGVCDSTLFADDFSQSLDQWRSFYNRPDSWMITDDDNPQLCHIGDGGDFLLAENSTGNDYRISTDANLDSGNGYGLLFRASENENGRLDGYTLQYDPGYGGGQFIMRKWVNGYELWPPFATAKPSEGFAWHDTDRQIKVDVQGDTFTAYVDGQEVLVGEDDSYPFGEVGIRTWNSSDVCFDNFTVETR